MCKSCGCKLAEKAVQYECQCQKEKCDCSIIEFEVEPKATPYCCGLPMKQIK